MITVIAMPATFEIIQSGVPRTPDADAGDASADDPERIARRLRRDPEWAAKAGELFDTSMASRVSDVQALVNELKESQSALTTTLEEARGRASWLSSIEGAERAFEKLPEYVKKAHDANRRMRDVRERMEKLEQRVGKLPNATNAKG